jgi:hypothetical protein
MSFPSLAHYIICNTFRFFQVSSAVYLENSFAAEEVLPVAGGQLLIGR